MPSHAEGRDDGRRFGTATWQGEPPRTSRASVRGNAGVGSEERERERESGLRAVRGMGLPGVVL